MPTLSSGAEQTRWCLDFQNMIKSHMAPQCFHSEYFDSLLHTCKPCHLRCSSPPVPCQPYCNPSVTGSTKGVQIVLWTFLGLTLIVSLVLFALTFLLRKMNSEALKDKLQNPGPVLLDKANNDLMHSRVGDVRVLPRSLECTVEDCTCEDCVNSNPKADSDHFFPLPAMEEGATILVTTKTRSQNDDKRQFLLERLLDAVKQCQIRFGGRKEIASDSDSRVTCLCAQFEAVLQHGMKRSRGLALTAAAIKQAAGFASKTETEPVFWFYVKEVLNKHELQRFYSLHHITADVGRGRAWLRCALNEHSLERYLHMLLADRARLSTFYEDWSFVMDEERSSMLPTMAAGLNSILFAINIDNKDLNGQSKFAPTVSDLLKESTQNVTSLLKESTQGMSSLLREITASSAVSILIKPEQETDPLPVISKNVNVDARCKRERRRRKKVTNIVSFDDDDDEPNIGDTLKKIPGTVESSSINIMSTFESPFGPNSNGSQSSNSWKLDSASLNGESGYQKLDVKSIDDDVDENEEDVYRNSAGRKHTGHSESPDKPLDGNVCLPQVHGWAPLQVLHGDADADTDVLFPVSGVGSYVAADAPVGSLENGTGPDDHVLPEPGLRYSMEASSPGRGSPLSSLLPSASMPESMTVHELRQAIVAMMNRKDELEEENGYCDIMAASFSDILSPVAERMDGENGALLP
ncbi:sorting nexin-29-like protein [Cricetulus griseus]|nr:sorting nexin-29-like protein [Cricetulus griseus]